MKQHVADKLLYDKNYLNMFSLGSLFVRFLQLGSRLLPPVPPPGLFPQCPHGHFPQCSHGHFEQCPESHEKFFEKALTQVWSHMDSVVSTQLTLRWAATALPIIIWWLYIITSLTQGFLKLSLNLHILMPETHCVFLHSTPSLRSAFARRMHIKALCISSKTGNVENGYRDEGSNCSTENVHIFSILSVNNYYWQYSIIVCNT